MGIFIQRTITIQAKLQLLSWVKWLLSQDTLHLQYLQQDIQA